MRATLYSVLALSESFVIGRAEAFLDWSDAVACWRSRTSRPEPSNSVLSVPKLSDNRKLIENCQNILRPFLVPECNPVAWPLHWASDTCSLLSRLLNRQELDLIESVGGYRARLDRIYLYLQFASRIRRAVFSARRLNLRNLDGATRSFDRMLRRDREMAICLFLIYAAVPMATLKLGNPSQLLDTVAGTLQEFLNVRTAAVVPIRSLA
jgi:hypothetical protein